ncbi:bacillithiol system redox-active protein YtxJ [Aquimarina sp. AD10]|uniref:Cytosolic protein n=1 Tax=Aquimarina aggregata TaxID=1642818 RepID=A0A162DKF7_9FLAO|nr:MULTISPECIES: bacillithiol system redox-active protein YtxJ [Aquimarina]AXT63532.1 bacillithiol system redox-active protein YtxJ [Aquimarina sp. AD10]KZS41778.1 cytosolic protein [Aquimarina aggregata]RKM99750.1 bacillithiol system redox-active protein YtxJ [Aquimarina sp. AD10]
MGIFNKLFGSEGKEPKEEKQPLPWQELKTIDQLNTITKASKTKTQAIFKHSTRCGISRMVIRNFESSFDLTADEVDLYYLDLLNHRNISDEISAKFQVFHESPQFIVIRNGVAVHHSSHSMITPQVLHQYV